MRFLLDDICSAWTLKIISHFLSHGEDKFLRQAGNIVYDLYPSLWDEGYAGSEAKRQWVKDWEQKRRDALRKEYPEP